MTSQFYNRYVPPASLHVDTEDTPRPAKKRKKSKTKENPILSDRADGENQLETLSPNIEPLTPKKHKGVLSKFERAAKTAEKARHGHTVNGEDEPKIEHEAETILEGHGLVPLPQPAPAETDTKASAFSALPKWLQSPTTVSSTDSIIPLTDLPISKEVLSSLQINGYSKAFAIQSAILPMLLPTPQHYPGDLCVSAATGSGKTLAYALPMIEALRDKPVTSLRGLIVVPTRELVNQVKKVLDVCNHGGNLKIGTAIGSRCFNDEQALLVQKEQKYDPEAFKAEQAREIDEDEDLMDWNIDRFSKPRDDFDLFFNHVVEYTSKVDILICTPGRLVEHIQSTTGFTLQHVQWLVIDEADRLLDESFQQWVDNVLPGLEYMPPPDPLQEWTVTTFHLRRQREVRKIILSATMTRDISKLTTLKLKRPRLVVLEGQMNHDMIQKGVDSVDAQDGERVQLPRTLQEVAIKVPDSNDKPLYLVQIIDNSMSTTLKDETSKNNKPNNTDKVATSDDSTSRDSSPNPSSSPASVPKVSSEPPSTFSSTTHGILIFTRTNTHATRLALLLTLLLPHLTPHISTLTKSTSSSRSQRTLRRFRRNKVSILIASDRASRGLDIPNLAHVINYDMPTSVTNYVHRVGRTARAGREGRATTLIEENEARWFWREIARGEGIWRGKKVERDNTKYEFDGDIRRQYEEALEKVGKEVKG